MQQHKQSPYFRQGTYSICCKLIETGNNQNNLSGYQAIVENLKKRKAEPEDNPVPTKPSHLQLPTRKPMNNQQNDNTQNVRNNQLNIWNFVTYKPDALKNPYELFDLLMEEIQFDQGYVTVYGKTFKEPRLTSIHSDEPGSIYEYSGRKAETKPITKTLESIRKEVSSMFNTHYNSVILNFYRDGNDKIGKHSDKGNSIDLTDVLSVSLGASRRFIMYNKKSMEKVFDEALPSGSVLRMHGECQRFFVHEVPAEPDIAEPRINLTFRKMKLASNSN